MPQYLTLQGTPTKFTDPNRGVWYSARCHYWTDDWSKLKLIGPGIPTCPECGCPGFQTTYEKFTASDVNPPPKESHDGSKPLTSWLAS